MRATWRHRLEYAAFRLVVCFIECLPVRCSARLAENFAAFVHYVLPRKWTRYDVAAQNLRKAFGEDWPAERIERTILGMWVHLFRTVVEVVQSTRKLHAYTYRRQLVFHGLQQTNEALLSGRRVLVLGGHFGNWELSISLMGIWGFPMGVVAREMDNPLLDAWFRRFREFHGHRQLGKRAGYDDMLTLLQRGGNLGLLGDQDAGPRGLFVDFFGHPASTVKSIALLSLEYDAPTIVGCAIRLPDDFTHTGWSRFLIWCEDVIDPRTITAADPVREITQRYTSALERVVRRYPEQYFWLHRRWKSEPRCRTRAHRQAG
uniref:Lipid A biosynthesis acyltransferase n=1 Tax=Schlesneria paludicola TaxID=360056 RepID=A0A7C4QMM0_9PLAN